VGLSLLGISGHALSAGSEKPVTILGMVLFEDLFFNDVVAGMKAQAKKEGVNLVIANSNHDLATEKRLIETYIKLGVNAMMVSPVDADKSVVALQQAHDKGIKGVAYNDNVNAPFVASTVSSSQSRFCCVSSARTRRCPSALI
jgi:ABC-type sugar transport system substrate-binding protein